MTALTPPTSPPPGTLSRPVTASLNNRSSRMSTGTVSKMEGLSRTSDDELRTSVKVAVRIRPPLKPSDPGFALIPQRFQKSMVQTTSPTSLAVASTHGRKLFVFDRVFGEDIPQDGIFEYIGQGLDAFIQGFNVSVMAYGQSGAGKSFTMGTSGPNEQGDAQLAGIIPRAATSLFDQLSGTPGHSRTNSQLKTPNRYSMSSASGLPSSRQAAERGWQLRATYVEIYNETLRDLLIPDGTPPEQRTVPIVREDKGRILLTNLTQVDINSVEDLLSALNYGSSIRQTDATAINARSSRSHAIFSLNLVQRRNRVQDTPAKEKRMSAPLDATLTDQIITTDSKLHFVDLAGSERLKNTGASGERAKEGIAINVGLASLGKVISQLSSRQPGSHVSYRDSKLTRILQDSLGGNAVTYLIACVTPAEFHLSETLNTVQYAQRARAIQTKPQIQQVSDDSDKQAVIDRLRTEISFLRDQIRIAREHGASMGNPDRPERQNEREAELQEHLLDVQESYSALSKRHARLVSEISKANHLTENKSVLSEDPGERLKRAESYEQGIEQMVGEYEKTIQTLEATLSKTRSMLASTEGKLLEHETKIAYIETVNQQLQTRVQKFMDRESSLESYVRDLEARMDGRIDSDDRNNAIVNDLRKELNRLREAEATSEDYITTLEERLVDADSDMELMNREINRLEHTIDRQRSVGKLDNLLQGLDGFSGSSIPHVARPSSEKSDAAMLQIAAETPLPEHTGSAAVDFSDDSSSSVLALNTDLNVDGTAHSPTQMQFVEEKLDAVNQELISLRVDHESTVNEYELLNAKYEEALRTMAAMQSAAADGSASNVAKVSLTGFLADARVNLLKKEGQFSSSRSPSSELSSVVESPSVTNDEFEQVIDFAESDGIQRSTPGTSVSSYVRPLSDLSELGVNTRSSQIHITKDHPALREIEDLKVVNVQKDGRIQELSHDLESTRAEQDKNLEIIANLKGELQKARAGTPNSPTAGHHFVRRKSGHNVLGSDRTNRAFVSLGNIASDHLEDLPDVRESFNIQLTALSHEMQNRGERVEALEAELANAKKEMEAKMQIISGLARERSSMKTASPIDISVVSTMRDQLVQNENHIKALQDQLASRESELTREIRTLKATIQAIETKDQSPNEEGEKSSEIPVLSLAQQIAPDYGSELIQLRDQLSKNEARYRAEVESAKSAESQLIDTISELEATLSNVDALRQEKTVEAEDNARAAAAAASALELERQKLLDELEQQKATISAHSTRYAHLQEAYESMGKEMDQHSGFSKATAGQLENHRAQITMLEQHIQSQYDAIEQYKETIQEMADNHAKELEEIQVMRREEDEEDAIKGVPEGRDDAEDLLQRLKTAEFAHTGVEELTSLTSKMEDLLKSEQILMQENSQLRQKEERASRLVEELERQLTNTYEDNRHSSSRLSTIHQQSQQEVAEARTAVMKAEAHIAELTARLQSLERSATPNQSDIPERANSMASRKSVGIAALPSPPPAIPLPPLPANAPHSPFAATFADAEGRPTSPPFSPAKRDSATQARIEEQEARIKTIEKHLFAEKQLTATLEEALVDLENQGEKTKKDAENWRKKAQQAESELTNLKQERNASQRHSVQQMEDERRRREEAEQARARLEEKMALINKKKKKSALNCF